MKRSIANLEKYRITTGQLASEPSDGVNGAFMVPGPGGVLLGCIVSDGTRWEDCGLPGKRWEHVSVSLQSRTPTWQEMDFVKRLFWDDRETVIQLHVPRQKHINLHDNCLHLWRPVGHTIPLPPKQCV